MRYYAPVLTILRFIAVAVVVYYLYVLVSSFVAFYPASFREDVSFAKMMELNRDQLQIGAFKALIAGLALYFFAPLLARIITLGSDNR